MSPADTVAPEAECEESYKACMASRAKRVQDAIAAAPEKSDRAIATELGVSDRTVNRHRATATGDAVEKRIGRDGKARGLPRAGSSIDPTTSRGIDPEQWAKDVAESRRLGAPTPEEHARGLALIDETRVPLAMMAVERMSPDERTEFAEWYRALLAGAVTDHPVWDEFDERRISQNVERLRQTVQRFDERHLLPLARGMYHQQPELFQAFRREIYRRVVEAVSQNQRCRSRSSPIEERPSTVKPRA